MARSPALVVLAQPYVLALLDRSRCLVATLLVAGMTESDELLELLAWVHGPERHGDLGLTNASSLAQCMRVVETWDGDPIGSPYYDEDREELKSVEDFIVTKLARLTELMEKFR